MSEQTLRYHLKFGVDKYEQASNAQLQFCVDRIAHLEQMLRNAREKLVLYRQAHSGEYIGGVEFTTLINSIDAALTPVETEVKP